MLLGTRAFGYQPSRTASRPGAGCRCLLLVAYKHWDPLPCKDCGKDD
jgi:hypothetical protein